MMTEKLSLQFGLNIIKNGDREIVHSVCYSLNCHGRMEIKEALCECRVMQLFETIDKWWTNILKKGIDAKKSLQETF